MPECPSGQTRRDDTAGHCCWPDQAWSSEKDRCVGVPSCPHGMIAHGEACVAQSGPSRPALGLALQLGSKSYAPGAEIRIQLSSPITSSPGNQAWIAVGPARSSPTTYSDWKYLDDHATRAVLRAPNQPGAYEVRLYTDYPAKSYNVRTTTGFEVAAAATQEIATATPTLHVPGTVHAGDKLEVTFGAAVHATAPERYWITIAIKSSPDREWGAWQYVPDGAHAIQLDVPDKPGAYEVRLHGNYPTKTYNVVERAPITVE
jgi:hypothetical protein